MWPIQILELFVRWNLVNPHQAHLNAGLLLQLPSAHHQSQVVQFARLLQAQHIALVVAAILLHIVANPAESADARPAPLQY